MRSLIILLLSSALFCCNDDGNTRTIPALKLESASVDERLATTSLSGVSVTPEVELKFSDKIDASSVENSIVLSYPTGNVPLDLSLKNDDSTILVKPTTGLLPLTTYNLQVSESLKSQRGKMFGSTTVIKILTAIDSTDKFQRVSDDELLTMVQHQTFRYFFDFAHPKSGMARERNTSGNTVTSGGSDFGIMALIVGVERGFITREQALERMNTILTFLETCDRFHGAWPHWLNGDTGKVIPFSTNDNGGDLVETSYLVQGLLTFRQYLVGTVASEKSLIDRINALWTSVEWSWYTQNQNVLYWHWSPDKQWIMNQQIKGYNEALITYVLAASSPTFPISPTVYHQGWASNGAIKNGKQFYGVTLPLGPDFGGPLFFSHYSFLGLDPRNLKDDYASYWEQNTNHSLINLKYCIDNPKKYYGYSAESWGLTASDNPSGYSAHSPTNDLGVITPSAALSSMPYTPDASLRAMRFFYYKLGNKLWGPYGFYDAFSLEQAWFAGSYLAIDQGPIVIMIENYRSGLLWKLFMSAPEVNAGLDKLGFQH